MADSPMLQPSRRNLYILGGIFIVSLIFLITGCVLIGVGSHKLSQSQKKTCPQSVCSSITISNIFTTAWDPAIPWMDDYYNSSSKAYAGLKSRLQAESMGIVTSHKEIPAPVAVIVNRFQPSPDKGTIFFSTFSFSVDPPPFTNLHTILSTRWKNEDTTNPTSQCSSMYIPKFDGSTGTYPPTIATTSSPFLPNGAYCDATTINVQTTFLVDVAMPNSGTLDDKLAYIRQYLSNYDNVIGLHSTQWNTTKFDLIVYNGLGASSLGSCTDDNCWHNVIAKLNSSTVNPTNNDFHSVTIGLQYILNRLSNPIIGQGKNIIIISDGYDITKATPTVLATDLKSRGFYIGSIVATVNQVARDIFSSVVSDNSRYYPVDDITWITNPAIYATSSQWTCTAYYSTPAPPLIPSTRIPLVTSESPVTAKPVITTQDPNTSGPSCKMDILFLIEDSLIMSINNGFKSALSFALQVVEQSNAVNKDDRYAIITFNNVVTFSSSNYLSYDDIKKDLNNVQSNPTSTLLSVGFAAAETFVSKNAHYNQHDTRPIVYFINSGTDDNSTDIVNAGTHSHNLRSLYQTQLISLDVEVDSYAFTLINEVIDAQNDGFVKSYNFNVTSNDIVQPFLVKNVMSYILCKGVYFCNFNYIFAIEVSSVEQNNYVDLQVNIVNTILNETSGLISPTTGKVTLVYYSSDDDTGTLYSMLDDAVEAQAVLGSTTFTPLGAASTITTGLREVLKDLNEDTSGSAQMVVIFGRGVSNNEKDLPRISAEVRSKATVKGVVLGRYSNITSMNDITGSESFNGNAFIFRNSDGQINITSTTNAIVDSLIPQLDVISLPVCTPVTQFVQTCEQFEDITIILHASSQSNWEYVRDFTATLVVPSLFGPLNNNEINMGTPVNLAVITYFGDKLDVPSSMNDLKSSKSLFDQISNLKYQNVSSSVTNLLSRAYREAGRQINLGRPDASKTVLVISDAVDFADYQSALNERARMPFSFIYGLRVQAHSNEIIPGQDAGIAIGSPVLLSIDNPRSSYVLAEKISKQLCRVYKEPTNPPPTDVPTVYTPGPIPQVKVRDIWPDVTILIDVSNQTFDNFETMRSFLQTTFRDQFYISSSGSLFTVATFDSSSTKILCSFSDINNYWNLYDCLGPKLSYQAVTNNAARDINQALQYINANVYSSIADKGFRPLKENYLYVFSLGSSSSDFTDSIAAIRSQPVRTIAVDVTHTMTAYELSRFGPDSYSLTNWESDINQNSLRDAIISQATTRPAPMLNSFYSDFYFIVDQSASVVNDITNIRLFVKNFVNLLTISNYKSRVSIVPFSDIVSNNNLALTNSMTNVNDFLTSWIEVPSGSSNIQGAIDNVVLSLANNNGNARNAYVIYLVGPTTLTLQPVATQIQNHGAVSYVLRYVSADYTNSLTKKSFIYDIDGSEQLDNWAEGKFPVDPRGGNPMNKFFNNLYSEQLSFYSKSFPISEISADILIFLDETGMSSNDFNAIKNFLKNFVNQFFVSNKNTQFALQAFNGDLIPEAGFHLWESTSNNDIARKIDNLRLEANPTTTQADLTGAINQGLNYFLDPTKGWRESVATYSIILTNSINYYQDAQQTANALKIKNSTKVFGITMDGLGSEFVNQFINTGFFEIVNSPTSLSCYQGVGKDLLVSIDNEYKEQVYPSLTSLENIFADHIFLIDHEQLSNNQLLQIKSFLQIFISSVGDFALGNNRLAIINYNGQGVISETSFDLTTYGEQNELMQAVSEIQVVSKGRAPNLFAAIEEFNSVYHKSSFGIDPNNNRTIFVTAFIQSSNISSPVPTLTTKQINLDYFTYALQFGTAQQPVSYLNQFLGSDFDNNYSILNNIPLYSTIPDTSNTYYDYNTYMQSAYTAWHQTHGPSS